MSKHSVLYPLIRYIFIPQCGSGSGESNQSGSSRSDPNQFEK